MGRCGISADDFRSAERNSPGEIAAARTRTAAIPPRSVKRSRRAAANSRPCVLPPPLMIAIFYDRRSLNHVYSEKCCLLGVLSARLSRSNENKERVSTLATSLEILPQMGIELYMRGPIPHKGRHAVRKLVLGLSPERLDTAGGLILAYIYIYYLMKFNKLQNPRGILLCANFQRRK